MIKKIEENAITINELTFLQFCSNLRGYDVVNRQDNTIVYRFILFWGGLTIREIKTKYSLVLKPVDYDD